MNDECAIQQVLNRYTQCANAHDYEGVGETYAPDGVWNVTRMDTVVQGRANIVAIAQSVSGKYDFMVQMNSPAQIDVTGDCASALSTVRESARIAETGAAIEIFGRYDDRLVRTEDGWRFAERKFSMLAIQQIEASFPEFLQK